MYTEESVLFKDIMMGKTQERKSVRKQREDGKDAQEKRKSKEKAP